MIAGDLLRCLPYAWRELESDPDDDEPTRAEEEGREESS
jgi:hypothetical protein